MKDNLSRLVRAGRRTIMSHKERRESLKNSKLGQLLGLSAAQIDDQSCKEQSKEKE